MKKNLIYIFLVFSCSFTFLRSVYAYSCYYNYDVQETSGTSTGEVIMYIDESEKTLKFDGGWGNEDIGLLDPEIDSSWTEKKLVEEYIKGACPDYVYACKVEKIWSSTSGEHSATSYPYAPLINANLKEKLPDLVPQKKPYHGKKLSYSKELDEYYFYDDKCIGASLNTTKSEMPAKALDIDCDKYDTLYTDTLKELSCRKDDCNSSDLNKYESTRQNLMEYCRVKLERSVVQDPCVKSCLNLYTDLVSIEGNLSESGDCGLSYNLIKWIKNILKWIKYILPVIVIILGIIDFIKAIASGSDDEMKKAQGRFIKRLIAAALVFLVPALIEFILDIFKIGNNPFCGLTD